MLAQVIMPQLGESVVEGTVGRWLVQEGQPIKQYEPLLTVTTDKVDTEIPAPATGILLKILISEGQTVAKGTRLAWIGEQSDVIPGGVSTGGSNAQSDRATAPDQARPPLEHGRAEAGAPAEVGNDPSAVTPLAERVAAEYDVDLSQVQGSGPGGRITREDVEAHLGARGKASRLAGAANESGMPCDRVNNFISPVVARLAAEYDIDLSQVVGTGEGGRIRKKDVMAYIATPVPPHLRAAAATTTEAQPDEALPPWEQPGSGSRFRPIEEMPSDVPALDETALSAAGSRVSQAGETEFGQRPTLLSGQPATHGSEEEAELIPLSSMRRSIALHMLLSQQTSAHVTTVMEADMNRVVQARERLRGEFERQGTRLTFTPFFLQAIVAALRAVPEANSTLREDRLLLYHHIHIGVAVALSDGLIVPVVRDADEKSLLGLARAVSDLAERARAKRLAPEETRGATFTLTNHGTAGSLFATPIINQPQAGILGVGAIQKRPVVVSRGSALLPDSEDYITIRPMTYLSFSFDHRILDGARADAFLSNVVKYLESYAA